MMASAAGAAGTRIHFAFLRHAAQFERLAHVTGNRLLDFLHLFLRIQEIARNGIIDERFPKLLEGIHFAAVQRRSRLLLLLQHLALHHQRVVLAADLVIGHESLDLLAHRADIGLFQEGLAKLTGFLGDDTLFGLR